MACGSIESTPLERYSREEDDAVVVAFVDGCAFAAFVAAAAVILAGPTRMTLYRLPRRHNGAYSGFPGEAVIALLLSAYRVKGLVSVGEGEENSDGE